VSNNALPRTFAVLILTILLTVILTGSPISSFGVTTASRSEDLTYIEKIGQGYIGSENQEDYYMDEISRDGILTNSGERQVFQSSTNISEDNDVIVGRCYNGDIIVSDNDEVTQTNIDAANLEANSDNESSEGDVISNTIEQASTQVATNTNQDNDLIIIIGCHGGSVEINDNDKVTQTNLQSADQVANSDNEEETDSDNEEETDSDNEEETDSD
jgi:preprotein translocase subunit SecD